MQRLTHCTSLDIGWPHIKQLLKSVVSIRLFYCYQTTHQTCLICTIPCWAASDGSLAIANEKGQTEKCRQPECCILLQCVPFTVNISSSQPGCVISPFFIIVKHKTNQDSQLTTFIIFYICFFSLLKAF